MNELWRRMHRLFATLILMIVAFVAVGCTNRLVSHFDGGRSMSEYWAVEKTARASTQRYIAERHTLQILESESQLQKSWEAAVAYCGTIQCEVISSKIATRAGNSIPSGSISLRVSPEDLNTLLVYVEKLGQVEEHTTDREDKTTEVVDTEAKIKNLASFRDSLREMLGKPSATVKDLVAIQQQLTDTQAQLDTETAQRKILANETEKIAVEISFVLEGSVGDIRGFAHISNALRESGDILADSTASLITTIVVIIPWLILIVPGVWLLVRAWKALRRRRRNASTQQSTTI